MSWRLRFARADVSVTINLRDFPHEVMATFGSEGQHPGEFTLHQLDRWIWRQVSWLGRHRITG